MMTRFWEWLDLDVRDGFFLVGLVLVAVGFWFAWAPLAPIICGLILVIYSITAAR